MAVGDDLLEIMVARSPAHPGHLLRGTAAHLCASVRGAAGFQSAGWSAFTVVWNYLAIVAIIFWLLFYVRWSWRTRTTVVHATSGLHLADGPAMYFGGTIMTFGAADGARSSWPRIVLFYLFRAQHSGPRLRYPAGAGFSSFGTREPGPVPAPPVAPVEVLAADPETPITLESGEPQSAEPESTEPESGE